MAARDSEVAGGIVRLRVIRKWYCTLDLRQVISVSFVICIKEVIRIEKHLNNK